MGKFCMNCGTELSEEDQFCQSCGQKVFDIDKVKETEKASLIPPAPVEDKVINVENSANNITEKVHTYKDMLLDYYSPDVPNKRNIWLKWVFSIVSMGVYNFAWTYFFVRDLRKMAGDNSIMHFVPAMLLSIVTVGLYFIYYEYKMGVVVNMIEDRYHVPGPRWNFGKYMGISVILGAIGLVFPPLLFVSIIVLLIYEYKLVEEFNRAVDYYGRG